MDSMSDMSAAERIQYTKEHAVDPEPYLLDREAIEEIEDGANLAFTPEFLESVRDHLETVEVEGVKEEDLATIFNLDLDDVEELDRDYTAYKIIFTIRKWPSEAALEFDVAVDRALRDHTDWESEVPPRQRYRILQSLRSFQDECLFCGGDIDMADEPVQSCCGEETVMTIYCGDCDRRFLEFATEAKDEVTIET